MCGMLYVMQCVYLDGAVRVCMSCVCMVRVIPGELYILLYK